VPLSHADTTGLMACHPRKISTGIKRPKVNVGKGHRYGALSFSSISLFWERRLARHRPS
jgi:hypothetical protein